MSDSNPLNIFPPPKKTTLTGGVFVPLGGGEEFWSSIEDENFSNQHFRLEISASGKILIRHGKGDQLGLDSAVFVFEQLLRNFGAISIPCCVIEDWPDVPVRGFMLDVSRGRVPKMSALRDLVKTLARLRYNQLQLYVEHTYEFKNHEEVWREASPLTAKNLKDLDGMCREHGIELVPNLNSFGHVERWLKHEKYKPLAECSNGFYHEIFKMQRVAGTFAACEETADFMGRLYDEFLPNFSSDKFNIGGDEPWELGQGRSRELCEKHGKRAVYLEHMARLKKRVEAHGKKMMFWGDVLLGEAGKIPPEFLRNTIPVVWGYDAGHPFDEQCSRVKDALEKAGGNGEFYLAPGTSSWLSFGTRQTNALQNIREACAAAKKHGATGVLLTTWGDFGYHNQFCANWLPLVFAAEEMWSGSAETSEEHFSEILDWVLKKTPDDYAKALFRFGKLDDCISKKITNRSITREMFFAKGEAFEKVMDGVPAAEIVAAQTELGHVMKIFSKISEKTVRRHDWAAEFSVALKMADAALRRADAFLKNDAGTLAAVEAEMRGPIKDAFAAAWKRSNREGGLEESLSWF
ncbi:MAG: beta-N-acetylhexosaminidase [Opitutales bacterium]|nr:beta-N-acetylhexosaminidase [Opitutales bacterium]